MDGREERSGNTVQELRRAAVLVRELARGHPRGPLWWADPDLDPLRPPGAGPDPVPVYRRPGSGDRPRERGIDPSESFDELERSQRPRPAPSPARSLDPSVAGPLADLLDAVADLAAEREEPRDGDEPVHSALRDAAAVLHGSEAG